MIIWLEFALTAVGVVILPYVGGWTVAGGAVLGACICLLMAGSLRVTGFFLKRMSDQEWSEDEPEATRSGEALKRIGLSLDDLPGRASALISLALYFAGVAAVLMALPPHAAAAGWAGSSVGLVCASFLRERRRLRLLVFMGSSLVASGMALLWVPPASILHIVKTWSAIAVMSAGACASGTSVLALKWRLSARLSLPASMGLAVWSLTWFFTRGEEFGHEPLIVAWGVGSGAVLAAVGYLAGALDGGAAGVVLFIVSRVYGFLDWPATIPLVVSTVLAWRPSRWWSRGADRGTTKSQVYASLHQVAAGALPLALAGAFFTFKSGVIMAVYLAACGASSAVLTDLMLRKWSRLRVMAASVVAIVMCAFPILFEDYAGLGARGVGVAVAGALCGWTAAEALYRRAPGWRELPPVLRGALMGGVAAIVAVCMATLVIVKDGHVL